MVVSGKKLGLLATVGLLLVALLPAACTRDEGDVFVTYSTATFPASEPAFRGELSGAGYYTVLVHPVPEGDTSVMEVWVWVDPAMQTPTIYEAIYDQAIALAKKHDIANSTDGRLRVVLLDGAPGESIGGHIIESRDFDLSGG